LREIDCVSNTILFTPGPLTAIFNENVDKCVKRKATNNCLHVQTLVGQALSGSEFPVTMCHL